MIGLAGSVVFYTLFGFATIWQSLPLLFVARIGAGMAGATISTAQAYIADATSLANRPKGMALVGMAFGLGFTFGPLLGYLAVPVEGATPGPGPGFAAAGISAFALLLAFFKLPESRRPDSESAARRWFDPTALRDALRTPSIALLLVAIFITVFSFAKVETTLSMLIKGKFQFAFREVCLTYAYIGLTLAVVQGGVVRRLAGRVHEGILAAGGALLQLIGFALIVWSINTSSVALLMAALAIVVAGFAFMSPSLNSLLSRRTSPSSQGGILGLGQSVNSLGRILGALVAIPMLKAQLTLPFMAAAVLMALGAILVLAAARGGEDYTVAQTDP